MAGNTPHTNGVGKPPARPKTAGAKSVAKGPPKTPSKAKASPNGKRKSRTSAAKKAKAPPAQSKEKLRTDDKGQKDKAQGASGPDPAKLAQNMLQVAQTSQQLVSDYMRSQQEGASDAPFIADPLNIGSAFSKLAAQLAADPERLVEAQKALWQGHMELWENAVRRGMGEDLPPLIEPDKGDRRFKHEDWNENQIFDFIKQSYLLTTRWLQETVANVPGLDDATQHKVDFYTKQMSDAFAPTNFLMTNPEAIRATIESNGENLVNGLNNILQDLSRGKGNLQITQTDMEYFQVGDNLATTPGKVIYQNELFQLLQFEPTTAQVYDIPLVIFPPWINKYYILDLRQDNSFIGWCLARGYNVFVVSWVNPDAQLARKTFEDYMHQGIFEALDAVIEATGCPKVNTIGYCIGGTLLGTSLAYMAAKRDKRINSATFFASQLDFAEAGDLKVFIDDEQLKNMETRMAAAGGYLEGGSMAQTFNMLRANDLIWSFVVNNYLLGKEPFRFDLLYWNADATRMPQTLHMFYLRQFYHENSLAKGKLTLGDETLDMKSVDVPVYMLSSREDHIAPVNSVFRGMKLLGGPVRFIVAGSGHIAGVINPPAKEKYQYWCNEADVDSLEAWWASAEEHPGSWWPDWDKWLSKKSGKKVPARVPGDGALDAIEDAPGSYVMARS